MVMPRSIAIIHVDVIGLSIAEHFCVIQFPNSSLHILVVHKLHNSIVSTNITITYGTDPTHVVLQILCLISLFDTTCQLQL